MTARVEFLTLFLIPNLFCQWFWPCGFILQILAQFPPLVGWGHFPQHSQSPLPPVCPAPFLMSVLLLVPCVPSRLVILLRLVSAACYVIFICFSFAISLDLASASFPWVWHAPLPLWSALTDTALEAGQLSCCGNTSSSWLASALGLRPSASLLILGCMMAALANCLLLSSKTLCACLFSAHARDSLVRSCFFLEVCWLGYMWFLGSLPCGLLPQRPRPLPRWKMSWPEPGPLFGISWDDGDWSPREGLGAPGEAWGRSCCSA